MHATITIILATAAAAAATAGTQIKPGLWKTSTEIVDFDMTLPAGTPPGVLNMIKSRMNNQGSSHSQCITAADIRDAPEKLVKTSKGKCSYDDFTMKNGKLHATATCRMAQAGNMTMAMDGTYTATTMDSMMKMDGNTPSGPMHIVMKMHGTRTGNCG